VLKEKCDAANTLKPNISFSANFLCMSLRQTQPRRKKVRRKKQKTDEGAALDIDANAASTSARKSDQEALLESFLFGSDALSHKSLEEADIQEPAAESAAELPEEDGTMSLFFDDRQGVPTQAPSWASSGSQNAQGKEAKVSGSKSASAWRDADDDRIMVNISSNKRARKLRSSEEEVVITGAEYTKRLQEKHTQLHSNASWAQPSQDEEASEEDSDVGAEDTGTAIMRSTASLQKESLASGRVDIVRLPDANLQSPSNAVVRAVEFHKNAQLLLTAGLDKKVRLFQVDGRRNPLVQSVIFPDMPVQHAAFSADGNHFIACGRRKFFYTHDLVAGQATKVPFIRGRDEKGWDGFTVSPDGQSLVFYGNNGYLVLLDAKSKQWTGELKMNGSVRASSFSADGRLLYSFGSEGQVYQWDMRSRRCMGRAVDDGCVQGTALCASRRHIVTGSDSGGPAPLPARPPARLPACLPACLPARHRTEAQRSPVLVCGACSGQRVQARLERPRRHSRHLQCRSASASRPPPRAFG
jgi:U3 small nucleolar RNA-associated protein 18